MKHSLTVTYYDGGDGTWAECSDCNVDINLDRTNESFEKIQADHRRKAGVPND